MPNEDYILRSDALRVLSRGSGCENICSNALKRIPAADVEPKQKCIPVTERLPEKGRVVLAFGTRSCTTGQFRGTGSEPWFWWWKGNTIKRVTHWMPLPEPPKEEKEEPHD